MHNTISTNNRICKFTFYTGSKANLLQAIYRERYGAGLPRRVKKWSRGMQLRRGASPAWRRVRYLIMQLVWLHYAKFNYFSEPRFLKIEAKCSFASAICFRFSSGVGFSQWESLKGSTNMKSFYLGLIPFFTSFIGRSLFIDSNCRHRWFGTRSLLSPRQFPSPKSSSALWPLQTRRATNWGSGVSCLCESLCTTFYGEQTEPNRFSFGLRTARTCVRSKERRKSYNF